MILIRKEVLQAALSFMPKKTDIRAYLNGISFRSDGISLKITASNGHVGFMHRISLDTNETFNFILPKESINIILSLAKTYKKCSNVGIDINDDNTIKASFLDNSVIVNILDANYPDLSKQLAEFKIPKTVYANRTHDYNPEYLQLIQKTNTTLTGDKFYHRMYQYTDQSLLATFDNNTIAIVMSWKVEQPSELPHWI